MTELRKTERYLIRLGALVFALGLYLFLFRADELSTLFGLPSLHPTLPLGKIEVKKNIGRRKFRDSNAFLPVFEEQTVFSRDSVMTGNDSEMTLTLNNGAILDLGPNTLVEIQANEGQSDFGKSEFIIRVKQGVAKGKTDGAELTLIQPNGETKVIEAAATPAAPIASTTPTATPVAAVKPVDCELKSTRLLKVTQTINALPKLQFSLLCPNSETPSEINLIGPEGSPVWHGSTSQFLNGEKAEAVLNVPGNYHFSLTSLTNHVITVERESTEINVPSPSLTCSHTLPFEAPNSLKAFEGALALLDSNSGKTLSSRSWDGRYSFAGLTYSSLKTRLLRIEFKLKNGFIVQSNPFAMKATPQCIFTKNPASNSEIDFEEDKNYLFTWSYLKSEKYIFEVSTTSDFENLVVDKKTTVNFTTFSPEHAGQYYWRIRSTNGEQSNVSSIHFR